MSMEIVTVGMFELPGISFSKDEMSDELRDNMISWSAATNCGMIMNDRLWSFKNSGQLDFFILRWADLIPKKAGQ